MADTRECWFVSGHVDLTEVEFREHYAPQLELGVRRGVTWVVGDSHGADVMAQSFLAGLGATHDDVIVYHLSRYGSPLNNPHGFRTNNEHATHNRKDAAMTAASVRDVAWLRPGRSAADSGTGRNLARRAHPAAPVNERMLP